jgi:hypothetical protein
MQYDITFLKEFLAGMIDSSPGTFVTIAVLYMIIPYDSIVCDIINSTLFIESVILTYGWYKSGNDLKDYDKFIEWFPSALAGRIASLPPTIDVTKIFENPTMIMAPIINSWNSLDAINEQNMGIGDRVQYFWSKPAYFMGFGLMRSLSNSNLCYYIPHLKLSSLIGSLFYTDIGSILFPRNKSEKIFNNIGREQSRSGGIRSWPV